MTDEQHVDLSLLLGLPFDENKAPLVVPVDVPTLWLVSKSLHNITLDESLALVRMVLLIGKAMQARPDIVRSEGEEVFKTVWRMLDRMINPDLDREKEATKDEPEKEDDVLRFTYVLLRKKRISRTEAASIATRLLGKEEPINVDAWRSRVDRWAARQDPKLPPVEIRKRGKKGKSR